MVRLLERDHTCQDFSAVLIVREGNSSSILNIETTFINSRPTFFVFIFLKLLINQGTMRVMRPEGSIIDPLLENKQNADVQWITIM